MFESRVISDGSQTSVDILLVVSAFESRVISDGSQTELTNVEIRSRFESRVISDGSQTVNEGQYTDGGLRVV